MNLTKYHNHLVKRQTQQQDLSRRLESLQEGLLETTKIIADVEQAREIVNQVLLITQEKVKTYIEEIVSLALSLVYGDEYSFEFEFAIKRNQTEVTPWIVKGSERFSVVDEVGGGVRDVASFALRLVIWSLLEPKTSSTFILDEPGRNLSRDIQPLFGQMLQRISKLLGVQVIMISHSNDLIESADTAYEVRQEKGISIVRKINA